MKLVEYTEWYFENVEMVEAEKKWRAYFNKYLMKTTEDEYRNAFWSNIHNRRSPHMDIFLGLFKGEKK